MNVELLVDSEHWILADKPADWLTTPARLPDDPRPCLGRMLQEQEREPIFPVHRLDFEVSGLVLFARTREAHREGQRWFEERLVRKVYHALSLGVAAASAAAADMMIEWRSKIVRGKRRSFVADHGQLSITRARVLGYEAGVAQWCLEPVTGRPHQLRVEMARHGHPILGDVLYGCGASDIWVRPGIALRAMELDFTQIPLENRMGLSEHIKAKGGLW